MRYYGDYVVVESYEDWTANWDSTWGRLNHCTVHDMDAREAQIQVYPLLFKRVAGWDARECDSLWFKIITEVKEDFLNSVEQVIQAKEANLAKDKQILERFE